ncbi:TOX high mobility group box family member 3 isoform C [Alligator mississippiensis]|uniref:TOX high mobility group box family member 3 isoform C n=1 Tax=Alligator mississippiensis TaxID=8496 RepID=A0A151MS08_ALLMI|nr:TOX high mobility group box family member 3 isoform C [Alligator mississippiensis]
MDVRFYPAAAGSALPGDPASLDFAQCLGYYSYGKFGNNNNYMNMAEANNAFLTANEQTFHTPSLGDEEFEIPPITPPPESDPTLGMADILLPFQGLGEQLSAQGNEFTPQFPPQSLDLPSITISRNLVEQDGVVHTNGLHMDQNHTPVSQYRQDPSLIMRSIVHMTDAARSGIMPPTQLTTINQSQLSTQLGLNLGGTNLPHTSPSPPASKSATPSPSSSINEEDADESNRAAGEKRAAPDSGKKPKTPKKKKKKDPNEPQKPVSAYALFFRDTQAAIKGQNPNATFGEVSKIVASMWDSLGEEQKQVYKRKTEAAKKEYLKALAAYRASLVSKAAAESAEAQTIPCNGVCISSDSSAIPSQGNRSKTFNHETANESDCSFCYYCTKHANKHCSPIDKLYGNKYGGNTIFISTLSQPLSSISHKYNPRHRLKCYHSFTYNM